MIPLPIKLREAMLQLDKSKNDMLKGWLLSMNDLEGQWSLSEDYSALIKNDSQPKTEVNEGE